MGSEYGGEIKGREEEGENRAEERGHGKGGKGRGQAPSNILA